MAFHAVEPLTRFRKHELDYPLLACPAGKAFGVERVVSGHDGLVEDGELAYFAVVAVGADGRPVGKEEEVGVGLRVAVSKESYNSSRHVH